ncbi:transcription elongation factor GreA [Candidatus Hakubella thermalkaliphila]|uniref:Transcription elongation factor GreA n=1 Tax=Candidatus Hakubella thermalkaliphila TaxID=2754717 RepID=A0A6V8P0U4_9ACTN|nr:transcription elongation factor GreA [Candidatus Hakubella thermalkaliphila]
MAREVKLTKSGYERLVAELEQERARLQDATRILQELMESSDDYDDSGLEDAKREKAPSRNPSGRRSNPGGYHKSIGRRSDLDCFAPLAMTTYPHFRHDEDSDPVPPSGAVQ